MLFPEKCPKRDEILSSFSLHVVVSTDDDEKNVVCCVLFCLYENFVDLLANEDTENAFRWIEKERDGRQRRRMFVRKKDGGPVGGIPREKKRWIKQGQKRPQKRP